MGNETSQQSPAHKKELNPRYTTVPGTRKPNSLGIPNQDSPRTTGGRKKRPSDIRINQAVESGELELSLAEVSRLSAYHQQILLKTWPTLKFQGYTSGGGTISIFRNLCDNSTTAKSLFQRTAILEGFSQGKTRNDSCPNVSVQSSEQEAAAGRTADLKEHARLIQELVDAAVAGLDKPAKIIDERCRQIGLAHCALTAQGFEPKLWDDLGDVLVSYCVRSEIVRKYRSEGSKAWTILLSFLVDRMKGGYLQESKRRSSITPRNEMCSFADSLSKSENS